MAYAHSPNAAGKWHDLVAHLSGVAELAAQFASPLQAPDLGRFLGLWHAIGKFHPWLSCSKDIMVGYTAPQLSSNGLPSEQPTLPLPRRWS